MQREIRQVGIVGLLERGKSSVDEKAKKEKAMEEKSMKEKALKELMLGVCIKQFCEILEADIEYDKYGKPPVVLWITYGKDSIQHGMFRIKEVFEKWKYSEEHLESVECVFEPGRKDISGMFFSEAEASLGFDELEEKAYINMIFGPRFGRGYEYDIVCQDGTYDIVNEKVMWVS